MAKIITVKDMDANAIGKYLTGYNCEAGDFKWRIFHIDGKKVYIITDDYIPFNVAPLGRKGTHLYVNDNEYMLSFDDIVMDYKGIQDITDPRIKALNSLFFKTNTDENTNINMKAVAFMLDTKAWGKFANENSEYAIGGPTLELFVKSYNLTHKRKLKVMSDEVGYMIKYKDENKFHYYATDLDYRDSLYFKADTSKAYRMWLASPSACDTYYVMAVHRIGYVSNNYYGNASIGFRPLACLKSDIQLEVGGDGYKIK